MPQFSLIFLHGRAAWHEKMTSTYNKRPSVRGKVYETLRSGSPAPFVQWNEPRRIPFKLISVLSGFIPFAVLSFIDWLKVESIGLSKFGLLTTSMDKIIETFSFTNISEQQFAFMKLALVISAGLLILSLILVAMSLILCATGAKNPLAFTGFSLGTASHLVFIATMISINQTVAQRAIEPSLFAYFALLAGIISLIYCIKFPVVSTSIKNKRNSFATRILTSFVPVKGDGIREGVRKVIFTAALVSFIYFASTLGVDLYNEWRAERIQNRQEGAIGEKVDPFDPVREKFQNKPIQPLEDYLALFKMNNDMVGYIKIGDTAVKYSVLQTDNNEYYLDYDFDGNRSRGGWIFADCRNKFNGTELSDNTVLYGHNISTGNYFAALSNYYSTTTGIKSRDLSFYKENPVIRFDTMYEHLEWKVFGCVLFNTQPYYGEVIRYWDELEFANENEFHDYIFMVMDRSVLSTDVDLQYGDKLLTLSTCYWPMGRPDSPGGVDTRVVIFARQVRPGESSYVDTSVATHNPYILRFTEEAKRYGNTWKGRVWDYKKYLLSYKE